MGKKDASMAVPGLDVMMCLASLVLVGRRPITCAVARSIPIGRYHRHRLIHRRRQQRKLGSAW